MAMRDAKVTIQLEVDKKTGAIKVAGQEIKGLGAQTKQAGAAANTASLGFGTLLKTIAPLIAVGSLVRFFKDSAEAAFRQEDAVNKLNDAMKTQGFYTQAASRDLQDYAASLQKVTRFGDEAIIEVQAMLTPFGLFGDKLKETTAAVLDMSTSLKVDLKAAAILMGKAFTGETSSLSRYGIILDENVPKAEKFAAALKQLQDNFGGSAAADAATLRGELAQMGNAFGDIQERLIDGLNPALRFWIDLAKDAIKTTQDFIGEKEKDKSVDEEALVVIRERIAALQSRLKYVQLLKFATKEDTDALREKMEVEVALLNATKQRIAETSTAEGEARSVKAAEDQAAEEKRIDTALALDAAHRANVAANEEAITKLVDKSEKDRIRNAEKANKLRVANFQSTLSFLASASSSGNREIAAIGKAAAIAQATQDTYAAADKAMLAAPGPAGWALAAATIAIGLANVAKIASVPGFAKGGTAPGGRDIVVGEEGPEVLRSPRSGTTITPASRAGGGGSSGKSVTIQNLEINFSGVDPRTPDGRREIVEAMISILDDGDALGIAFARKSADTNANNAELAA